MDITEGQVFEAMGVKAPDAGDDTAADTQETAEKSTEQIGNAGDDDADAGDAETPTGDAGDKDPGDPKEQTNEERRANAARRRQREQREAIDKAVGGALAAEREKAKKDLEGFFSAAGLENTLTGEPITDMEGFNAWKKSYDAAKLERDLRDGKLTPEGLNAAISSNPVIQRAEETAREREEEARRTGLEAAKAKADADVAEISKLDPEVKELGDLVKMDNYEEFFGYVQRGNTLLDAYYTHTI